MSAPKGNQFWRQRSKHGRDKIFESSDLLWDACTEYFDLVESTPLQSQQGYAYQGKIAHDIVPHMRAMTMEGLCTFLDIAVSTWDLYRSRNDFMEVISRVEAVMRDQKFTGAAAGLLNANIIARDLGLKDASKSEITGANGGSIDMAWTTTIVKAKD